jgi:hypothetical protein
MQEQEEIGTICTQASRSQQVATSGNFNVRRIERQLPGYLATGIDKWACPLEVGSLRLELEFLCLAWLGLT